MVADNDCFFMGPLHRNVIWSQGTKMECVLIPEVQTQLLAAAPTPPRGAISSRSAMRYRSGANSPTVPVAVAGGLQCQLRFVAESANASSSSNSSCSLTWASFISPRHTPQLTPCTQTSPVARQSACSWPPHCHSGASSNCGLPSARLRRTSACCAFLALRHCLLQPRLADTRTSLVRRSGWREQSCPSDRAYRHQTLTPWPTRL